MPGERSSVESRVYKEDDKNRSFELVPIVRSSIERANIQTRVFRKARPRTTIVSRNFSDRVIAVRHGHGYFGCLI